MSNSPVLGVWSNLVEDEPIEFHRPCVGFGACQRDFEHELLEGASKAGFLANRWHDEPLELHPAEEPLVHRSISLKVGSWLISSIGVPCPVRTWRIGHFPSGRCDSEPVLGDKCFEPIDSPCRSHCPFDDDRNVPRAVQKQAHCGIVGARLYFLVRRHPRCYQWM